MNDPLPAPHAPPRSRRRARPPLSFGGLAALLAVFGVGQTTEASEDYSGVYVLLQQTTVVSEVPVVADLISTTRAISIQTLRHDGQRLVGSGQLCTVEIESSSSLVRTEIPAALRRVMPKVDTDARLELRGDSLTFVQPPKAVVMGARLADPRDPMPRSKDDARVYDQDGDGKPGVTVRVKGIVSGEVYVAQRSISALRGARRGSAFTGRIDFSTEDVVLDASSAMLKRRTNTRPDPERSFFRMERLGALPTCQDAVAAAKAWR